jgi:vitamin B12 transporter
VTTQGVEVALSLRPADTVIIDSHATYTGTDIENSADELRNRPEWRAGITTTWEPRPRLLLTLGVLHVGEVFDASIPTGNRILDDYQRVDVSGTWSFLSGLSLSLAVDNLLDAEYQEAIGFPAPGLRVRFSAGVDL